MSKPLAVRARATGPQASASDPTASSWVTASAGTGKTQVLTDRVLRVLLAGTEARAILCLTFTRAAAAEMKVRLTEALAKWATAPEAVLREDLRLLMNIGGGVTADEVRRARRLFAEVLDAPGGLKVLTIHAFCESLLARFPVESGVAAHFEVMDERTAAEHLEAARDRVLQRARNDADLAAKVGGVTARVNEQRFGELMQELARHRARIRKLVSPDIAAAFARVRGCLGLQDGEDAKGILAEACRDGAFDPIGMKRACAVLRAGAPTFVARGTALLAWMDADPRERADRFLAYREEFFTDGGDGKRRDNLLPKAAATAAPDLARVLEIEADRIAAVAERLRKADVYDATSCLLAFASALLTEYERGKERHALLDYDDLILKTRDLLAKPGVAPWVLYKLDGGIDHILIDEAQDTSPEQWQVIKAIADEFFAGKGAHDTTAMAGAGPASLPRTVFAVGDSKQSIFGFLQADPQSFGAMRAYFETQVRDAEENWRPETLIESFRTVAPILKVVDTVFDQPPAQNGLLLAEPEIHHVAHRKGQAGYFELWPTARPEDGGPARAWDPPFEQEHRRSASAQLADRIAETVLGWVGKELLPSRGRPVRPGDIMILVQRRATFVEEVVRALKLKRVAVAGTDRMLITEQLPVQDLMALGHFALLPEDDLTLATVLKGPLVGLSEESLFDLAAERPGSLWAELRRRTEERLEFAAAVRFLRAVRKDADFATPHAFFASLLAKGGRRLILGRLGPEANDPIDEFLARALEYERAHAPSLQGFLDWIGRGQVVVKRDLEVGRDEVRVLTVHGAKGLQAPIVFLADTCFVPQNDPLLHWRDHGGKQVMLWTHRVKHADAVTLAERDAARARREEEYHRLLYVAMTRAEDRLIVCGFETKIARSDRCWYSLIESALQRLDPPAAEHEGGVRRLETLQDEPPDRVKQSAVQARDESALPPWTQRAAPGEPAPQTPLTPSRPSGFEPPAYSPLGGATINAGTRRGVLIHRLLQLLPGVDVSARVAAAARFLGTNAAEFSEAERGEMSAATLGVLGHAEFADLFGPNSRAEVPVVGVVRMRVDQGGGEAVLSGQIDRLVVRADHVLIVDYKTHRPAPKTAADAPAQYVRQMAAYRGALAAIYPGRPIRCALLWTDGPRLMELSATQLDGARD